MPKKLFVLIFGLISAGLMAQSSSISPNRGAKGQTLPIIISGQNTNYQAGSPTVRLQYTQGTMSISQGTISGFVNLSVNNPNQISGTLVIPTSAPNGNYDLIVVAGSSTYDQSAFTVQPSTSNLVQMSPVGGKPGTTVSGITMTIPGGSFKSAVSGINKVWLSRGINVVESFSNINVQNSTTFTTDLSIPANLPEGLYDINVYENSGAMHVTLNAFEVDQQFSLVEGPLFNFSYFPNPAQTSLKIEYSEADDNTVFTLLDLQGRTIQSLRAEAPQGQLEFNVADMKSGMYLLRISRGNEVLSTQKWQKR